MYENIHVLNFRVNIFSWEPHKNILTRKFVNLEIIVHLDIQSLSCATAKCSQTPALNKTARCGMLEHVAMEISTCAKMVSNLTPYASFQCRAREWLPLKKCYVQTFINESVILRLVKILPAGGNQQTKVIYTQ